MFLVDGIEQIKTTLFPPNVCVSSQLGHFTEEYEDMQIKKCWRYLHLVIDFANCIYHVI